MNCGVLLGCWLLLAAEPVPEIPAFPAWSTPQPVAAASPVGERDSLLVSVNGEPITLGDVLAETREAEYGLYASRSGAELRREVARLRRRALEEMIDRKLLIAAYRRDPFPIPAQYVESLLDDLAERAGVRSRRDFAARVRASGSSIETLRRDVEERLIVQAMTGRIRQVTVQVTPREMFRYFESNRAEFDRPERWTLSVLVLGSEVADRAERRRVVAERLAADPAAFAELARAFSSAPSASAGGSLGRVDRSGVRPEFAAALAGRKPGDVVGPLELPEGDVFLRLDAVEPAVPAVFREHAAEIRDRLERAARERFLRSSLDELRREALIRWRIPETDGAGR